MIGKRAISEVFSYQKERIIRVFVSKGAKDSLIEKLENSRIPVKRVSSTKLYHLAKTDSHGSFVAELKEKPSMTFDGFLKKHADKENLLILALDGIFDPQNVGAILRAAECFGVDLVCLPKRGGCGITPVVTKASSGASEILEICTVSLNHAVVRCEKEGIACIAAEKKSHAQSMYEATLPKRIMLIMGSEGEGVRSGISKSCDQSIFIPLFGKIDSLNVAQATSILLSHIRSLF